MTILTINYKVMSKVFCVVLLIAGVMTICSCASLFREPTPFEQYPYAAVGIRILYLMAGSLLFSQKLYYLRLFS